MMSVTPGKRQAFGQVLCMSADSAVLGVAFQVGKCYLAVNKGGVRRDG